MSAVFLCAFAAAGFRVLRQNPRYAQKRACREVETMQQDKVLRDGDLIFQTSLSGQSRAIQEATGSKLRHHLPRRLRLLRLRSRTVREIHAARTVDSPRERRPLRRKEAGRRGQPAHRTKHRGDAPGSRTVCRQGLRPDLRMVGRPAILFRTHLENIRPDAGHPTGQPAATGRFRPLRTGRPGETRRTLRRRAAPRRTGHLPRCHLRFPPPRPRHRPVTCRE